MASLIRFDNAHIYLPGILQGINSEDNKDATVFKFPCCRNMRVKIKGCSLHQERNVCVIACDFEGSNCISRVIRDYKSTVSDLIWVDEAHGQVGSTSGIANLRESNIPVEKSQIYMK